MMDMVWEAAIQTPWWVYVLFIYLVKKGVDASKPHTVSIIKLSILPLIFLGLSLHTILISFHANMTVMMISFSSLIFGSIIGWLLVSKHRYQVDKKKLLIQLQGSSLTLILILAIFISKYYFGYQLSADPALINQTSFEFSMLGVSGICTGLFVGRVLCFIYQVYTRESVDLIES